MLSTAFIYKLLLILLHSVYTIFDILFISCVYLRNKLVKFCHETVCIAPDGGTEYVYVNTKNLSKIPAHVTVLLGTEDPSYKDITNIIFWCVASGISFISFYDNKGILKKTRQELKWELDKRRKGGCHIIWHNTENSVYKNGISGRKIHVKLLSACDGRECVVIATKRLAEISVSNKDISVDSVDSYLRKHYEFPDPDLGIYCGKTFSLFGYPPWQVRVTEFLNLISHHNITPEQFVDLLLRYQNCEQRLGK